MCVVCGCGDGAGKPGVQGLGQVPAPQLDGRRILTVKNTVLAFLRQRKTPI